MPTTRKRKETSNQTEPVQNKRKKKGEVEAEVSTETKASSTVESATNNSVSISRLVTEPTWAKQLESLFQSSQFKGIERYLNERWSSNAKIFPPCDEIFHAFNATPFDQVKVVLLGQDPYHDDGQAHGLSFSVPKTITTLPPSLKNIYKELATDIPTFKTPSHGCLEKWAKSGVLLLNATLTVEAHSPNSHSKIGWLQFTDGVIQLLSKHRQGLVFLLWGGFAHSKEKLIDQSKHTVIKTAHPSPLSLKKFLGCRCFSKVNAALESHGQTPIDWTID